MVLFRKLRTIKEKIFNTFHFYQNHYFGLAGNLPSYDGCIATPQEVSDTITQLLVSDKPCMISRFGNNELKCMLFYLREGHPFFFMREYYPFWVPEDIKQQMVTNAGFFPRSNKLFCRFSDLLYDCAKQVDLLGSWIARELIIESKFSYLRSPLMYLEPYWAERPWTKCLEGKKVLVVHPFAETINTQYTKRVKLFSNPDVLPDFEKLIVIPSVQSIGGEANGFHDWFEALHYMENQIDAVDYDIALIGCGAYGMPLAAHCKKMGKKAVHLGGALQLLFGIKGHRWEADGFAARLGLDYKSLLNNPYWVRPNDKEVPKTAQQIEGGCYW